jgi:hypothetical protein
MRIFAITTMLGLSLAGEVVWEKPEAALAKAAATGMPICYYFTVDAVDRNADS